MTSNPHNLKYKWVGSRRLHVIIVEKALGRRLKKGEQVHHLNLDSTDNGPGNFVLCPNKLYHSLLHRRTEQLGLVDYCRQNAEMRRAAGLNKPA